MGLDDLLNRVLGRAQRATTGAHGTPPRPSTFRFPDDEPQPLLKRADELAKQGLGLRAADCMTEVALGYWAAGFFLKSISCWKQVLKLDPGRAAVHEAIAWTLEALGLHADATAPRALLDAALRERVSARPPPERARLRAMVADAPDAIAPRLVFTDWLLERADPLGDYLRSPVDHLLDRHEDAWLEELRPLLLRWEFRRGFVEAALVSLDTFVDFEPELFAAAPLIAVHVVTHGASSEDDGLERAFTGEHAARIERLVVSGTSPDDRLAARLVKLASRALGLRELALCSCGIDEPGARSLVQAFPGLRLLDLRHNGLRLADLAPVVRT